MESRLEVARGWGKDRIMDMGSLLGVMKMSFSQLMVMAVQQCEYTKTIE